MAWYLDTSAAVKLVVAESGSTALLRWLRAGPTEVVTSDLTRTELLRATRRAAPDAMLQARAVLDSVIVIGISTATYERAATLEPADLRSLDALHLASALSLGDDLDGIVTYDQRLVAAASAHGIRTVSPR